MWPYRSTSHLATVSFFFMSSCHLLALHSFPTRRSSDLIRQQFIDHATRQGVSLRLRDRVWAVSPKGEDRKSTRLNSSHQIISYAVFCLKKKKTKKHLSK